MRDAVRRMTGAAITTAAVALGPLAACQLLAGIEDLELAPGDGGGSESSLPEASVDAGCTADVATDPANCGACGRSCGELRCIAGACETLTIATAQNRPACVAIDAVSVYWATSDGDILSAPKQGGASTKLAALRGPTSDCIVDAVNMYWTTSSSVERVPLAGGPPFRISSVEGTARTLAQAENGTLYWTNVVEGKVFRCNSGAGCGSFPILVSSGLASPYGLTLGDTNAYWTNKGDGTISRLYRGDGGTDATVIATSQASPSGMAVDPEESAIYWVNQGGGGAVMELRLDGGGAPLALASVGAGAESVALDAARIYWTNPTDGTVSSITKDGKDRRTLATGQMGAWDIAVDETHVYWVNKVASGSVVRVPK